MGNFVKFVYWFIMEFIILGIAFGIFTWLIPSKRTKDKKSYLKALKILLVGCLVIAGVKVLGY